MQIAYQASWGLVTQVLEILLILDIINIHWHNWHPSCPWLDFDVLDIIDFSDRPNIFDSLDILSHAGIGCEVPNLIACLTLPHVYLSSLLEPRKSILLCITTAASSSRKHKILVGERNSIKVLRRIIRRTTGVKRFYFVIIL